ncbi:SusC, outer membrane protein [Aquipluma nitroreducens]|uniref:SusC, outer membrane protein n=1 Tax=Aquipluma nitroreducens TaxID=2010828 RepID=A0A5K7SFP6_9BACT|nr:SusC/RagA family TonB-linked outer membrane protein [Aquipluma nitroreducens]BBE20257.1 SusC, outer membrane protein [Aquipluma nitroreducens]
MKKNCTNGICLHWYVLRKALFVMKLTVLIFLITSLSLMARESYSQETRISLNMKNVQIKDVLLKIENTSEFFFIYNNQLIDVDRNVSINVDNEKISNILHDIFKNQQVDFQLTDKKIVIVPITPSEQQSQSKVSGKVTDPSGSPLPGVTVLVKGTTIGVITDSNGNYSLSNIPENAVLQFSFVGMTMQEVKVGAQSTVNVVLKEETIGLDEVVAIGYGTSRKKDLTGAVVNVKAEELMKYRPASVSDLLRSSVAGLKVGYSTDAKATPDFSIRGTNTIKSNPDDEAAANKPLIVVDGVIFNGDLSEINVNDVETVDVLKDASAASIYGSRASNGVVVFTTKKGASNAPVIRFSAKYGVVTSFRRLKTYNGDEVMNWLVNMKESINSKLQEPWSQWTPYDKVPDQYKANWLTANGIPGETDKNKITSVWLDGFGFEQNEKENYMVGKSYDWQNWLFHTGQRQDYNFNVSGRANKVTYFWSIGLKDYESLQVGETFKSVTSRLNFDISVTDFLNVGLNANIAYEDEGQQPIDPSGYISASPFDTPWGNGMPQTKENLKLSSAGSNLSNPLLDPAYITRKFDSYRLSPTMYAKLTLPFGIVLTSNFTQRLEFGRRFQFDSPAHPLWTHGGMVNRIHTQTYGWQTDNILNWNKDFGPHRFSVTGLWNRESNQSWETDAYTSNFSPNANLGFHEMAYGLQPSTDSYDEANSRTAMMGRVNYAYQSRYNLSASIRRDGYSRFGSNHLYATFPSLSAGWTLSEENFMAANKKWLSTLKLRATWGVNGNSSGIGPYAAYARMQDSKYLNYSNGYIMVPYLYVDRMQNANLSWEKNQAWNLGIDYGFWDGRLKGALDLYTSKTTDLLLDKKLPIVTGFNSITTNVGNLKNSGFDLSINTENIKSNDFSWTSSLNISYNKNEILSLTGEKSQVIDNNGNPVVDSKGNPVMKEPDDTDNGWFIGQSKDVIWDYKVNGVYQVTDAAEAAKYDRSPGDFRVVDQNGDGKLNSADKVFQGLSSAPWYITFRNDFRYKNFDMGIILFSKLGYKGGSEYPFNNQEDYIKNHNWYKIPYWTPDNKINDGARVNSIRLGDMMMWIPKSYVRFQNLSVGYNLPKELLHKINFGNARIALNIDNIGLVTKWKMGDPESLSELPRIYSFSVDLSF